LKAFSGWRKLILPVKVEVGQVLCFEMEILLRGDARRLRIDVMSLRICLKNSTSHSCLEKMKEFDAALMVFNQFQNSIRVLELIFVEEVYEI
jgi:hypothetical protein